MTEHRVEGSLARSPGSADLELGQPLPADLVQRVHTGLFAYYNYPVFSRRWLGGRTLLFALAYGGLSAIAGLTVGVGEHRVAYGLSIVGYMFTSGMLMSSTGPALATWVRHRRMSPKREQVLIVAALLVGLVVAAVSDHWSSTMLRALMQELNRPVALGNDQDPSNLRLIFGYGAALVIYVLLGGGLALMRYFGELRKMVQVTHERAIAALQTRQHELDARLALLQAQVEPHFLFNTLASLHSLIGTSPPTAQVLVDELANYLRATIPKLREASGGLDSTLDQQLEICRSYLQVMRIRMGDRLKAHIDVEEALRPALFPPLLLMTLVENAVKHGIESKRGPGTITVRAWSEVEGRMLVRVSDDGVGLTGVAGTGVGLSNLREWLGARYGHRATFVLEGSPRGGAEATLEIPLEWSQPSNP